MKKKNEGKKTEKKELNWINDAFAVDRVNNYSDDVTFFTLVVKSELGNIYINGCRVVSGSKGDFISLPTREYEKGKYTNIVFIALNEEIQDAIINAVSDMI